MLSQTVTILSSERIEEFRVWLCARGKSEQTVKAYTSDLTVFLKEIDQGPISREEYDMAGMNWLTANRRILSPKTTNRRLTSLRAYAQWAGWGRALVDYATPHSPQGAPHPLPEGIDGVRRMVAVCKNENQQALICLCGMLGLRVSEALFVRPSHFELNDMVLTVHGKGEKIRLVPISSEAWDILSTPVTRAFISGDALVVGLRDRFARKVITDCAERACLKRRVSSHDLRATFGTEVFNHTLNIRIVQDLLGHSSVETTQIYTGVNAKQMRDAVEI